MTLCLNSPPLCDLHDFIVRSHKHHCCWHMLEYESYINNSHKMKVNTEVVVLVCVGSKSPLLGQKGHFYRALAASTPVQKLSRNISALLPHELTLNADPDTDEHKVNMVLNRRGVGSSHLSLRTDEMT